MHTDVFLKSATSKNLCEDYIFNAQGSPHIVLSDGCSSSHNTDVGARILTHIAYAELLLHNFSDYETFKQTIVERASTVLQHLCLPSSCLDATLVAAFTDKENLTIRFYGDGACFFRLKTGQTKFIRVKYDNNAPYYLSYALNNSRLQQYYALQTDSKPVSVLTDESVTERVDLSKPLEFTVALDEFSECFIMSDGIEQVVDVKTSEILPPEQAVILLTDIKNPVGKCLQRSCKWALRHRTLQDDLTIGMIRNATKNTSS